jgi:hypothetical protein
MQSWFVKFAVARAVRRPDPSAMARQRTPTPPFGAGRGPGGPYDHAHVLRAPGDFKSPLI